MQKAKQKAQQIMDQEGLSENLKMRQVQKLYKKSKSQAKEKKRVVVGTRQTTGKVKQGSRKVKYVDKRMKKEKRAQKRVDRLFKRGKRGSTKRQVKRKKGKK